MQIWLDTANLSLIEQATKMGVLHGVTTNPSIVAASGMALEDLVKKILQIQKGQVTVQVTAVDADHMIEQAKALHQFSDRIIVKIPVTQEGLKAIHALSKEIVTMATAVFDVNQVLLASKAGAAYIAPYYSRICEADINGIDSIRSMLNLLRKYNFSSQLLAASLQSSEQVKELLEMGAHAVTLKEEVFKSFVEDNELTLQSVRRFANDWRGARHTLLL